MKMEFINSALSTDNHLVDTNYVKNWIKDQNQKVDVRITKIRFNQLEKWMFSRETRNLKHVSGSFFSIDAVRIKTNWGEINEWEQPIINQPEIGYLGFIVKEFNGILHFLMQAKIEPGNINYVQLSPTLQATKSNYTRIHNGKAPSYLEYFTKARSEQIILDQLQSEQGARFLKKRNRNIIIKVTEEIPIIDNFIWLTLAQIKLLMYDDNLINMDTRTVISGIPFGTLDKEEFNHLVSRYDLSLMGKFFLNSLLLNEYTYNSFDDIINYITQKKCTLELEVEKISVYKIRDWHITDSCIEHTDKKYFKVIPTKVEIDSREVVSWTQPMIEPSQEGICVFVCKEINGVIHFIVQTKLEAGNFDIIEFAPTVQCLTGNYRDSHSYPLPFLKYVLNVPSNQIIYDTLQSEEGGRFFREQNRNMIVLAGNEIINELPDNYIWMTLNQLQTFIKFNNYINIQARSLLAAIKFN